MRDFEKISYKQFKKDIDNDKNLYENFSLPIRDSKYTAGYDIFLIKDLTIKPNEIIKIPTGIKAYFESDEVLFIVVRSGTGFKYNIRLVNQIGIIDSDYYNNIDNEGHIFIKIQNHSSKTITFKRGESIVQGIFLKYLTTTSDITNEKIRGSDY